VNKKKLLVSFLTLVILVLFIDPFGATVGFQDIDSYRPMRDVLDKTKNSKVLYLASYDDYYNIEPNFRLRNETSEGFAELGYESVLSAASLGDATFNSYLYQQGFTHVVVPLSTALRGRVIHKWGQLGSVSIILGEPFFEKVLESQGEFPVVLYKVLDDSKQNFQSKFQGYALVWDGVPKSFFELNNQIQESGMYAYTYTKSYLDGPDVSWVLQDDSGVTPNPRFVLKTPGDTTKKLLIEIKFAAAYGGKAPTQIIRVFTPISAQALVVKAGESATVTLVVNSNQEVAFDNILPCRAADTFAPDDHDPRVFCYGISEINVRELP
jgi:hypothetical protein